MSELTGPQTLFAALPGCGPTTDIRVAALVRSVLCILLAALLPGKREISTNALRASESWGKVECWINRRENIIV